MSETKADEWVFDAVMSKASEFSDQLRGLTDTSERVPNLDWSVADLGQHVAGLPKFWLGLHDDGEAFELPADVIAFTDAARAGITETDPTALADLVDAEFGEFVSILQSGESQRWMYGIRVTPIHMCGLGLNELTQHGRDLAGVTGATPPDFDQREANAAVEGLLAITPAFIDRVKAQAQPDGVYHVAFRGGKDFTWTKQDDSLTITEGKPKRADAHLKADPAMFLYASMGRVSQLKAGLSGKMISYGRRPWRFFGLQAMAVDGV